VAARRGSTTNTTDSDEGENIATVRLTTAYRVCTLLDKLRQAAIRRDRGRIADQLLQSSASRFSSRHCCSFRSF